MEIRRDRYLNRLIDRMHNGMVKVVTGIRRCGKTYLLFNLFGDYLRSEGVDDDHIIEVALDVEENAALRDPLRCSLTYAQRSRTGMSSTTFFSTRSSTLSHERNLRTRTFPSALRSAQRAFALAQRRRVCDGSNSKPLSHDVMTGFRGRGDEVRVRPLSFSEFMQGFDGDRY